MADHDRPADDAEGVWLPGHGEELRALHEILLATRRTERHLKTMEHKMADLQTALNDLTTSVDSAVTALQTSNQPLKDALAQAQQALADLQVQDDADKAALQAALDQAQSAADNIETQVGKLSAATTPTA